MVNGEGCVKVVFINILIVVVDQILFFGKVYSLSWVLCGYEEFLLLVLGFGGVVVCLEILVVFFGKVIFVKECCWYLLFLSKQRWYICSVFLFLGDFLVCGDCWGFVLLFFFRLGLFKDFGVGGKVWVGVGVFVVGSGSSGGGNVFIGLGLVFILFFLYGKQGVILVICYGGYVYIIGCDGVYYQLFV